MSAAPPVHELLLLEGVSCNPEETEGHRHRPGSEREGHFLYGPHAVPPRRPPAEGATGRLGDSVGQVEERDHASDHSSDHHARGCFSIKGSVLTSRANGQKENGCLSSLHRFLRLVQVDLSSILPEALPLLGSFLRKNQRALKLGTLACLTALVTHNAARIKAAALEPVLIELPALLDDSDMHVSQVGRPLLQHMVVTGTTRKRQSSVGGAGCYDATTLKIWLLFFPKKIPRSSDNTKSLTGDA